MAKQNFDKKRNANTKRKSSQQKRSGKRNENKLEGHDNNKFREEDTRGNTSGSNSPDWYGGNSILMQNAAQISFHTGAGRAVTFRDRVGNARTFNPSGLMVFNTLHNPGYAGSWNSPINLASRKLYTFVRHVNSGHANYDAVDLMMYINMMDNAYAYYAWMVRTYGAMHTILARNRYTPVGLIKAMGVDYTDISSRMADFLYYINLYAHRLNQMAVPGNFTIFQRHMWLYSSIYADAPSEKAQFYLFNPHAFWSYEVTSTERYMAPTIVIPSQDSDGAHCNLNWIIAEGDVILNQILQREDFNIMSGDIMKAYGDNLFKLNPISADYTVTPVYDPEVLLQIHNASVLGMENLTSWGISESWRVSEVLYDTADAGALMFKPKIPSFQYAYAHSADKIIDMPIDNPNPAHIAIATRFTAFTNSAIHEELDDSTVPCIPLDVFSTEVILNAKVFSASEEGGFWVTSEDFTGDTKDHVVHFEMRPFNVKLVAGEDDTYSVSDYVGDITNYAVMDVDSLRNINEAAALAMFNV